jgi:hypothetical protein
LAHVFPGIYNYQVYYVIYDGWSNVSLATCINCGELFVIDWENPKSISEIAASKTCPKCDAVLNDTLRNYPEVIRLPNGELGSYIPDTIIPPDNESVAIDFFELRP